MGIQELPPNINPRAIPVPSGPRQPASTIQPPPPWPGPIGTDSYTGATSDRLPTYSYPGTPPPPPPTPPLPPRLERAARLFGVGMAAIFTRSANAQYEVGVAYLRGAGVGQDSAEAVKWFVRAADQGHVGAKEALRSMAR